MKIAHATALTFILAACASSGPRKAELPLLDHNMAATKRVDILPGGHGSGVVIDGGLILTCFHVAGDGTVVAFDKDVDLAVIRVDYQFDQHVVFEDMKNVHEGDTIYNIGYPYSFGRLVDKGTVSALHYDDESLGVKKGIVVAIDDGPGTSGSGMFAAASGKFIGTMKLMVWDTRRGEPPRVIRILTDVRDAEVFLKRNGIPFHTEFDAATGGSAPTSDEGASGVQIRIIQVASP